MSDVLWKTGLCFVKRVNIYEGCWYHSWYDHDTSLFTQNNHFISRSHQTTLTNHHTSSKTRSQTTGVKQGARNERKHEKTRVGNHNTFGMMNPKDILRVQPMDKCLDCHWWECDEIQWNEWGGINGYELGFWAAEIITSVVPTLFTEIPRAAQDKCHPWTIWSSSCTTYGWLDYVEYVNNQYCTTIAFTFMAITQIKLQARIDVDYMNDDTFMIGADLRIAYVRDLKNLTIALIFQVNNEHALILCSIMQWNGGCLPC